MRRNIVALFDRSDQASGAVAHLRENGIGGDQVSLIAADRSGQEHPSAAAAVGGLTGAALGLTALVIPEIGPVVGVGPLLGMLAGPGGGLVGNCVAVALKRLGLSMEEAKRYTDGIRTGGAVLAVISDDQRTANELRSACAAAVIERDVVQNRPVPRDQGDIEKTATGPAQFAPENPEYGSSFDEFAGVFARDESVLLGDRAGPEYNEDRDAYSFGYRMASKLAGREWVQVEHDLEAEWRKQNHDDWDRFRPEIEKGWSLARGMG